jgi:hypothetical protein
MTETSDTNGRVLFNLDSAWVPLGKVAGAAALIAGAAVWADRITQQLNGIEKQVERLADEVHRMPESSDFRAWVKEFKALNPTVQVPQFESRNGG